MEHRAHAHIAVRHSTIQGWGVFAVEALAAGAALLRFDDSREVDGDHPLRAEAGESARHQDYLPDGTVVLMSSPERYINHSCDPNSYVYSVDRVRFLLTKRDIAAGEEIVVDYSINAVDGDVWECRCGASGCRGLHKCDFFALPATVQRRNLQYLDPWFAAVHAKRIHRLLAG
jgi:hypothetical protein